MAKGKKHTISVSEVHLELTWGEALVLRQMINRVSGDSEKSMRKQSDAIGIALTNAQIPLFPVAFRDDVRVENKDVVDGTLHFRTNVHFPH
jgi:hypothetical protein